MAHYFDDIFHRHVNVGTPRPASMPRMRRSSTARSISLRSDFDVTSPQATNGTRRYDDDDEDPFNAPSLGNSVAAEDPALLRERREADEHMNRYVSDQLERFRSDDVEAFEARDELEP